MVAGCGMTCTKYIIFFVNFLFFVMGVVAVALGVYALVDKNDMEILTMIDSEGKLEDFNVVGLLQQGATALIVGGSALLVLGFLGCCGAIKESKCLLGLYSVIVFIIVIVQLAAAGMAIAFREKVTENLQNFLKRGVSHHYEGTADSNDSFSRAFDFAQIYFECCGVTGPEDFNGTKWFQNRPLANMTVPLTCCQLTDREAFLSNNQIVLQDRDCPFKAPSADNPNTAQPCFQKIKDWILARAGIVIGIALCIVVIEILAIVMACCLCRAIED
ncbi:tetraspanin-18-like [Babylonia areolata]|uniref:tetraspanin-18-like n=1 Tax=Babylonia areolata TaxID=304850 RepID=UPI003FD63546